MTVHDGGQSPIMSEPVTRWLLRASASPSSTPADFVAELARVLNDAGHHIDRVSVWVPTLHPELWGLQVMWDPERGSRTILRDHDVTETADYNDSRSNIPGMIFGGSKLGMRVGQYKTGNFSINSLWGTLAQAFGYDSSAPPLAAPIPGLWSKPGG